MRANNNKTSERIAQAETSGGIEGENADEEELVATGSLLACICAWAPHASLVAATRSCALSWPVFGAEQEGRGESSAFFGGRESQSPQHFIRQTCRGFQHHQTTCEITASPLEQSKLHGHKRRHARAPLCSCLMLASPARRRADRPSPLPRLPPAHPSSSSCLSPPILAPPQRARRPSRCAPRIIFALYSLRLLDCGASEAAEPGTDATCGCSGLAA